MVSESLQIRLDKWLWAARFFKTRSQAAQAVQGGHVHLNNSRVKPAKTVNIGDVLDIKKNEMKFTVTVLALSSYRRPAVEAQRLYEETEESIKEREEQREMRHMLRISGTAPPRRPSKRDRRKIRKFTRKE